MRALRSYPAHRDACTQACNWIALLVASNQPLYPFYVRWAVGGDWQVAFWTFVSTPFFLAVPAIARSSSIAGRTALPLIGVANALLSIKMFGPASGVALFLIPCALIAALALRRAEWLIGLALLWVILAAIVFNRYAGAPLGDFDAIHYRHFLRLNTFSVAGLSIAVTWSLGRARAKAS